VAPATDALPPELVKELTNSADGFDAGLQNLRDAADALLTDEVPDRAGFIRHFETLSPSLQNKALLELRANPGLSFMALYDKVQGKLTLEEAMEARRWLNKLKITPR
jgi:hypothetical protein